MCTESTCTSCPNRVSVPLGTYASSSDGYVFTPLASTCSGIVWTSQWLGKGTISQCAANTYSGSGATSCTACPTGQTSPAGSGSASACTTSSAATCQSGSYNPSGGSATSACQLCPANTYTSAPNSATSCTACPPGQTSPLGGTSASACTTPATATCSSATCAYPSACVNAVCTAPVADSCGTSSSFATLASTMAPVAAGSSALVCPSETLSGTGASATIVTTSVPNPGGVCVTFSAVCTTAFSSGLCYGLCSTAGVIFIGCKPGTAVGTRITWYGRATASELPSYRSQIASSPGPGYPLTVHICSTTPCSDCYSSLGAPTDAAAAAGLGTGALAGIVIGALLLLIVILILVRGRRSAACDALYFFA